MAATAFAITPRRRAKLIREIKGMFDTLTWDGRYPMRRWASGHTWQALTEWDGNYDGLSFSEWFEDEIFRDYHGWNRKEDCWCGGKFAAMLRCCVRSGLDLASVQSGGVVGFTKNDIEKMYPLGVPGWIQQGWDEPWSDIPNDAGLWL